MALRTTKPTEKDRGHVVQVAVGAEHGLLLTDEGIVYSWGASNRGQLGRDCTKDKKGVVAAEEPGPVLFRDKKDMAEWIKKEGRMDRDRIWMNEEVIVQIACGSHHCLALSRDGTLYAWGSNHAGQLGITGFHMSHGRSRQNEQHAPVVVHRFGGKDDSEPFGKRCQEKAQGSLVVKSCSCGPESSTCVTHEGEVYVWGAASHHLFTGGAHAYAHGENCTLPVRVRGLPRAIGTDLLIPSDVSVHKDNIAFAVAHKDMEKELSSLAALFKQRSQQLVTLTKSRNRNAASAPRNADTDDLKLEELRELDKEFARKTEEMKRSLQDITKSREEKKQGLGEVTREVAMCDQQDRALADKSGTLQAKMQLTKDEHNSNALMMGQLKDITYFKESNRRTKLKHMERREALERDDQRLGEEQQLAAREIKRMEGQRKMIRLLQRGELGARSASNAALEAGFRVAARKRAELAATDPATLAGSGRFSGLSEVMQVADDAVDNASSRLREVTTVSGGGIDAVVLEEALEAIVRLRMECVALARERLWRLQRSGHAAAHAPALGDAGGAATPGEGGGVTSEQHDRRLTMLDYFFEAANPNLKQPPKDEGWGLASFGL